MKSNKIIYWLIRVVPAIILLQTLFFKFSGAEVSRHQLPLTELSQQVVERLVTHPHIAIKALFPATFNFQLSIFNLLEHAVAATTFAAG